MVSYNTETEVWKDMKGYEGYYKISAFGKIRSLDRVTVNGRRLKGKAIRTRTSKGYTIVTLHKEGNRKTFLVSRLVALNFLNNPANKSEVNHIDEDKSNNHVSNLEWCTSKENANHGSRNKRIANAMINKDETRARGVAMLDKNNGEVLKEFRAVNEAYRYLNRAANGNISKACRENKRTVYGYKWRFI